MARWQWCPPQRSPTKQESWWLLIHNSHYYYFFFFALHCFQPSSSYRIIVCLHYLPNAKTLKSLLALQKQQQPKVTCVGCRKKNENAINFFHQDVPSRGTWPNAKTPLHCAIRASTFRHIRLNVMMALICLQKVTSDSCSTHRSLGWGMTCLFQGFFPHP